MSFTGWVQIALVLIVTLLAAKPLGLYMAKVFSGERNLLSPVLGPVERGFYALAGVDPKRGQGWLAYAMGVLIFSLSGFVVLYAMLRLQNLLPFNPLGLPALSPDLAFNTAMSFVTNTNWQSYGGESTMSNFSQMVGLTVQNFVSGATGVAVAIALTRAFIGSGVKELGNFWVDLTRATLYVLLPISIVVAIVFVAMGLPQTLDATLAATTLEGVNQTISVGPLASQEAIKQLGTNGGGFFNVNAAHPLSNPNAFSDYLNIISMLLIPMALTFTFGQLVGNRRQGWAFVSIIVILLVVGTGAIYWAETYGNPMITALGVDPSMGNMEGKEVRFGQSMSALYAAVTTGVADGGVNGMLSSFTPLGGLVPLFLIQLGEVLPGGVGSGLYALVVFALLAVFVAGLMVGRTPEFLGKKVEAREMKYAVLAIIILPLTILGFTAVSAVLPFGVSQILSHGPHGLSEILYAFSSAAGNNGSAFAGLSANTPWYNTTLGIAMLLGRFAYLVPVLAIAGSLAAKTKAAPSAGTFPTDRGLFVGLMIGVILILGGLQFFPALALGPIVEHFVMLAGQSF